MRKINLIVLHCSATRETMEYTRNSWNVTIRRVVSFRPVIIIISAVRVRSYRCVRRSRFRHMRKGIMRSVWGFVTKAGWMPTGIRKIRVRRGKNCLSGDCCCCCWCGIRDAGSAGTVICRPTGMAMGRSRGMNG